MMFTKKTFSIDNEGGINIGSKNIIPFTPRFVEKFCITRFYSRCRKILMTLLMMIFLLSSHC